MEGIKSDLEAKYDVSVVVKSADLMDQGNVLDFYEEIKPLGIDVMINNAGLGDYNFTWDVDIEKMVSMLDLNARALAILSTLFVRDNRDKNAQLINVASGAGYFLFPAAAPYCATKFFVTAFTEGLWFDLRTVGGQMKVKILAPGPIDTEFFAISLEQTKLKSLDASKIEFHSADQVAEFAYQLYESDKAVGIVNLPGMDFTLRDPIHPTQSL